MAQGLLYVITRPDPSISIGSYHDWYDFEHLPKRLGVPGMRTALRYEASDHGSWLAIYDLDSPDVTKSDEYNYLKENASQNEKDLLKKVHMDRRVYKLIASHGEQSSAPAKVLVAVEMALLPRHEQQFHDWLDQEHIPLLSKMEGWLRSRRYELVEAGGSEDDVCKFLSIHEYENENAFDGEAYQKATSTKWRSEIIETLTQRKRTVWNLWKSEKAISFQTVNVNGIQFNTKWDGREGAPVIVLSNSLVSNLHMWDRQVEKWSSKFHVLRYDQRGHGETSQSTGPNNFDMLADDVASILDHFNITKVFAFIGSSMGGATALAFAIRHPGRAERLVCCDTQPTSGNPQHWQERIDFATKNGMSAVADATVSRWFSPEFRAANPTTHEKMRKAVTDISLTGYIANGRALQNYNYRDSIKDIKLPTLLMAGDHDSPPIIEGILGMEGDIKGAKAVIIKGAGHLPMVERPEEFQKEVDAFLEKEW